MLFLYPVFFYKNILLSFMIVFLTANKISSFGVRDEEEERTQVSDGERDGRRSTRHVPCDGSTRSGDVSFWGDTGADGQFAPLSALTVLPQRELSDSRQITHVWDQTKMRCLFFALVNKRIDFCFAHWRVKWRNRSAFVALRGEG